MEDIDYSIAKKIMEDIQYDNGAVNRIEGGPKFDIEWIADIAAEVYIFRCANPNIAMNEDFIEIMGSGGLEEKIEMYGNCINFLELDEVLGEYFETI